MDGIRKYYTHKVLATHVFDQDADEDGEESNMNRIRNHVNYVSMVLDRANHVLQLVYMQDHPELPDGSRTDITETVVNAAIAFGRNISPRLGSPHLALFTRMRNLFQHLPGLTPYFLPPYRTYCPDAIEHVFSQHAALILTNYSNNLSNVGLYVQLYCKYMIAVSQEPPILTMFDMPKPLRAMAYKLAQYILGLGPDQQWVGVSHQVVLDIEDFMQPYLGDPQRLMFVINAAIPDQFAGLTGVKLHRAFPRRQSFIPAHMIVNTAALISIFIKGADERETFRVWYFQQSGGINLRGTGVGGALMAADMSKSLSTLTNGAHHPPAVVAKYKTAFWAFCLPRLRGISIGTDAHNQAAWADATHTDWDEPGPFELLVHVRDGKRVGFDNHMTTDGVTVCLQMSPDYLVRSLACWLCGPGTEHTYSFFNNMLHSTQKHYAHAHRGVASAIRVHLAMYVLVCV